MRQMLFQRSLKPAAVGVLLCWAWPAAAAELKLQLPVACEPGATCWVQSYVDHDASKGARDHRCGAQTYDGHDGTDFRVPSMARLRAGVAVVAAADGRVLRVRDGLPDISVRQAGLASIKGKECGNGVVIQHADGWQTQYCHLAQGSVGVKPGDELKAGQPLGRVGLSGNTEFAHLHFTVRLAGRLVDPFAFGAAERACNGGASLWEPKLQAALAYQPLAIINNGFAGKALTMEDIESGDAGSTTPDTNSPALVAFVRAINLRAGDIQRLVVTGPDGSSFAENTGAPLDSNKAQYLLFAGKKRPGSGWARGLYRATYSVTRNGAVAAEQSFELRL